MLPLTNDEMLIILSMDFNGRHKELYDEFEKEPIAQLFIKRLNVFKKAPYNIRAFEKDAIIGLGLLSKGNPGRAVLSMIDTLEKADEFNPKKIDLEFICYHVYPDGVYSDEEFPIEFEKKHSSKYNFLL